MSYNKQICSPNSARFGRFSLLRRQDLGQTHPDSRCPHCAFCRVVPSAVPRARFRNFVPYKLHVPPAVPPRTWFLPLVPPACALCLPLVPPACASRLCLPLVPPACVSRLCLPLCLLLCFPVCFPLCRLLCLPLCLPDLLSAKVSCKLSVAC